MTRRTLLALALSATLRGAEGFAVITQKTHAHPLSKAQLKKLLLCQGGTWPGGGKMSLMLGPPNEPPALLPSKNSPI